MSIVLASIFIRSQSYMGIYRYYALSAILKQASCVTWGLTRGRCRHCQNPGEESEACQSSDAQLHGTAWGGPEVLCRGWLFNLSDGGKWSPPTGHLILCREKRNQGNRTGWIVSEGFLHSVWVDRFHFCDFIMTLTERGKKCTQIKGPGAAIPKYRLESLFLLLLWLYISFMTIYIYLTVKLSALLYKWSNI